MRARNNLLRRLAGGRLPNPPSLGISNIDVALNNCMRLVSGCLTSTPVEDLPVVNGIIPPDIRRDHLMLSVANKATEKNHMQHSTIIQHPNRPLRIHMQNLRSTDNSDSNNWNQRHLG